MLKKISIRNFRGFGDFDAELAPVSALLGPNSSGKTTVLQAVRLACESLRHAVRADAAASSKKIDGQVWTVVTADTRIGDHARLLAVADWRASFVDQNVGEGVRLSIELGFEDSDPIQRLHVEVVCARNEKLKLTVKILASEASSAVRELPKKSSKVSERLTEFVREHAPLSVFVPPFYGTVPQEEYRARAVVDRELGSGDQSHVVRNLVSGLDEDQFEKLNAFLDATVGARLTYRTTGDAVQTESPMIVRFRDTNGDIEISAAGAGLVNLVALYAALSRSRLESKRRTVIFLLDEPEAHLHPRLQAESAERLARIVTDEFGAQLLLATHSVDILNRLSARGHRLLRCDRRQRPSCVALDGDAALFDEVAQWADLTPYTAINFLASRRVAFCEGTDEIALLPRLAEVRFGNDLRRLERFRAWALIPLQVATNRPVAELLARLVRNDVVRASAQQGGFRVVVVLDRDHERAPGQVDREEDGVAETTWVWSKHSIESMLLDDIALTAWIRAFLGERAPTDLPTTVRAAIAFADADVELNNAAADQIQAHLATRPLKDDQGRHLAHLGRAVEASQRARRMLAEAPAVWQRGKDRGRLILGHVRAALPPAVRNQFPTDVVRLVTKTDIRKIGDTSAAIPAEVGALLDLLAPRDGGR